MEASGYLDDVILKVMGALDAVDSQSGSFSASGSSSDFATNSTGTSGRIASTNAMVLLREMASGYAGGAAATYQSPSPPLQPVTAKSSSSPAPTSACQGSAMTSAIHSKQHNASPGSQHLSLSVSTSASSVTSRGSASSSSGRGASATAHQPCTQDFTAAQQSNVSQQGSHISLRDVSSVPPHGSSEVAEPAARTSAQHSAAAARPEPSQRPARKSRKASTAKSASTQAATIPPPVPLSDASAAAIHRLQVELAACKRQRVASQRRLKQQHAAEIQELLAAQQEVDAGNAAQVAAAERQYLRNVADLKRQLKQKATETKKLQKALQQNVHLLSQQAATDTSAHHISTLSVHVQKLSASRDALQRRVTSALHELSAKESELQVAQRAAAAAVESAEEATAKNAALRRRAVAAEAEVAQLKQRLKHSPAAVPSASRRTTQNKARRNMHWRK
mgnify:CR=1 FL=1